MTTLSNKARCATCHKGKGVLKCEGCLQTFCFTHVVDHRKELEQQLEGIEVNCDQIQATLIEQTTESQKHPLLQKIKEWEDESIKKIRQAANEARRSLAKHTMRRTDEMEARLKEVTNQIRQSRKENDFSETDLRQWSDSLTQLKEELPVKPSAITLREDSTPLVTKIHVNTLGKFLTHHFERINQISVIRYWIF